MPEIQRRVRSKKPNFLKANNDRKNIDDLILNHNEIEFLPKEIDQKIIRIAQNAKNDSCISNLYKINEKSDEQIEFLDEKVISLSDHEFDNKNTIALNFLNKKNDLFDICGFENDVESQNLSFICEYKNKKNYNTPLPNKKKNLPKIYEPNNQKMDKELNSKEKKKNLLNLCESADGLEGNINFQKNERNSSNFTGFDEESGLNSYELHLNNNLDSPNFLISKKKSNILSRINDSLSKNNLLRQLWFSKKSDSEIQNDSKSNQKILTTVVEKKKNFEFKYENFEFKILANFDIKSIESLDQLSEVISNVLFDYPSVVDVESFENFIILLADYLFKNEKLRCDSDSIDESRALDSMYTELLEKKNLKKKLNKNIEGCIENEDFGRAEELEDKFSNLSYDCDFLSQKILKSTINFFQGCVHTESCYSYFKSTIVFFLLCLSHIIKMLDSDSNVEWKLISVNDLNNQIYELDLQYDELKVQSEIHLQKISEIEKKKTEFIRSANTDPIIVKRNELKNRLISKIESIQELKKQLLQFENEKNQIENEISSINEKIETFNNQENDKLKEFDLELNEVNIRRQDIKQNLANLNEEKNCVLNKIADFKGYNSIRDFLSQFDLLIDLKNRIYINEHFFLNKIDELIHNSLIDFGSCTCLQNFDVNVLFDKNTELEHVLNLCDTYRIFISKFDQEFPNELKHNSLNKIINVDKWSKNSHEPINFDLAEIKNAIESQLNTYLINIMADCIEFGNSTKTKIELQKTQNTIKALRFEESTNKTNLMLLNDKKKIFIEAKNFKQAQICAENFKNYNIRLNEIESSINDLTEILSKFDHSYDFGQIFANINSKLYNFLHFYTIIEKLKIFNHDQFMKVIIQNSQIVKNVVDFIKNNKLTV